VPDTRECDIDPAFRGAFVAVSVWIPKCPQLPSIREALQLVLAPVLEPEIRSGYQVNDRA
jgi:hypothetical protein